MLVLPGTVARLAAQGERKTFRLIFDLDVLGALGPLLGSGVAGQTATEEGGADVLIRLGLRVRRQDDGLVAQGDDLVHTASGPVPVERDTAIDLTPDEITEHYLIQCWPAPPAPPRTLSSHDQYGAQLRSSPPTTTEAPVVNRDPRGQSARERDILHRSLESDG